MNVTEEILTIFAGISEQYGQGEATEVIVFFLILGIIFFVLVGTFAFLRSRQPKAPAPNFERLSGMAGRLEKFEMEVNKFRTDTYRNFEFIKNRIANLEKDLEGVDRQIYQSEDSKGLTEAKEQQADPATASEIAAEKTEAKKSDTSKRRDSLLDVEEAIFDEDEESAEEVAVDKAADEQVTDKKVVGEAVKPESLSHRLKKTRTGLLGRLKGVFGSKATLDEETLEELELLLISNDLGVSMTNALISELKEELAGGKDIDQGALVGMLKLKVLNILEKDSPLNASIVPAKKSDGPQVVLLVGVNGVGKTTTAAKLAGGWQEGGAKVLLVAADTFRAAAVKQLVEWGKRLNVPVVSGEENAKPSTVVFDAMERAKAEDFDVVLIDTAGRLHTKSNLMQELEGVRNVIQRHQASAPHETILVVDGTTGQNAVSQAKEFNEAVDLNGLIITKLDGTSKGGIVVAIKSELGLPVRYIGVGESPADLRSFVAKDFVEALFSDEDPRATQDLSAHAKERRNRRDTVG